MKLNVSLTALLFTAESSISGASSVGGLSSDSGDGVRYEVWASDQSNSVAGESSYGFKGSYLWIWDSEDIKNQLETGTDAKPLPCIPSATVGPCDLLEVFPQDLVSSLDGSTQLGSLPRFGRLHGMIKDPQNRYVNANIFGEYLERPLSRSRQGSTHLISNTDQSSFFQKQRRVEDTSA